MHHRIPVESLGAHGSAMADAISTCVHCGFCLPACPTYKVLGEEMDSPRGRIVLMKEVLEGALPLADAAVHLDRCLGCLACETACPSGVPYRQLITPMRERLAEAEPRAARIGRSWLLGVMESPRRFRLALGAGRLARPLAGVLPASLGAMLGLLPGAVPPAVAHPALVPAVGTRRGRVALMTGCVQDVLRPSITTATARALAAQGVEVVIPPDQGCCGALAAHSGALMRGERLADAHRRAFPADVDAIVTTAAGCGSWRRERGAAAMPPAVDAAAYLDALGLVAPLAMRQPRRVAYQDACHLSHGQQVTAAPRRLLQQIDGLTLVPLADAGICCGSAGLYNIEQPALAAELGRRKAAAIADSGADLVVSGNIGCLTQLASALAGGGHPRPACHTMELIADPDVGAAPGGH
ncbi:MAG: (Fe-S)-binding protein [Vicinamibacterales bacterium]